MHGYDEDKAKVIARLRRIEGQVRAITQMVEDDKYCIDILTQISASNSALKSVALLLLLCVVHGKLWIFNWIFSSYCKSFPYVCCWLFSLF